MLNLPVMPALMPALLSHLVILLKAALSTLLATVSVIVVLLMNLAAMNSLLALGILTPTLALPSALKPTRVVKLNASPTLLANGTPPLVPAVLLVTNSTVMLLVALPTVNACKSTKLARLLALLPTPPPLNARLMLTVCGITSAKNVPALAAPSLIPLLVLPTLIASGSVNSKPAVVLVKSSPPLTANKTANVKLNLMVLACLLVLSVMVSVNLVTTILNANGSPRLVLAVLLSASPPTALPALLTAAATGTPPSKSASTLLANGLMMLPATSTTNANGMVPTKLALPRSAQLISPRMLVPPVVMELGVTTLTPTPPAKRLARCMVSKTTASLLNATGHSNLLVLDLVINSTTLNKLARLMTTANGTPHLKVVFLLVPSLDLKLSASPTPSALGLPVTARSAAIVSTLPLTSKNVLMTRAANLLTSLMVPRPALNLASKSLKTLLALPLLVATTTPPLDLVKPHVLASTLPRKLALLTPLACGLVNPPCADKIVNPTPLVMKLPARTSRLLVSKLVPTTPPLEAAPLLASTSMTPWLTVTPTPTAFGTPLDLLPSVLLLALPTPPPLNALVTSACGLDLLALVLALKLTELMSLPAVKTPTVNGTTPTLLAVPRLVLKAPRTAVTLKPLLMAALGTPPLASAKVLAGISPLNLPALPKVLAATGLLAPTSASPIATSSLPNLSALPLTLLASGSLNLLVLATKLVPVSPLNLLVLLSLPSALSMVLPHARRLVLGAMVPTSPNVLKILPATLRMVLLAWPRSALTLPALLATMILNVLGTAPAAVPRIAPSPLKKLALPPSAPGPTHPLVLLAVPLLASPLLLLLLATPRLLASSLDPPAKSSLATLPLVMTAC